MPLILIEGCDSVGKTTLIKKLADEYPHIQTLAFPTQYLKDTLPLKKDTLDSILKYHYLFLEDFVSEQERIHNMLEANTLVVLDRYTPSNYIYLENDLTYYFVRRGLTIDEYREMVNGLHQDLVNFYKELEEPDVIICLDVPDSKEEVKKFVVKRLYRNMFTLTSEKNKNAVVIPGLQDSTYMQVKDFLKDQGYI